MNTIDFAWSTEEETRDRLIITIDGADLISVAETAEQGSATQDGQPGLAGAYTGLPKRLYRVEDHLLGRPNRTHGPDGATPVLVCCGCLEAACWPLVVHISVLPDSVRWSDFSQPHRDEWDHSTMGPFEFSRTQYEEAIRSVTGESP